ncbi:MAG: superoxide dismutase [Deltaproteobacteria bacterium]|nr:superoxide dismutase [Deltaproteobacteria bacterium]
MYSLPELLFAYDALEPVIDKETMEVHHKGHHKTYVEKINTILSKYSDLQKLPIEELLSRLDDVPAVIRNDVRNQGGGHYTHSLFWRTLSPRKGLSPTGELANRIDATFGGFSQFKERFSEIAIKHFGSGYAWLSVNPEGELIAESLPNQDTPLLKNCHPVFLLDLWEHAYYLKYRNRRAEFVKAFWEVVNWAEVSERFNKAKVNHFPRQSGVA